MNILIIGHGFVGKAVDYGFSHPDINKVIVDPKYGNSIDNIPDNTYSVCFVCVPTPMADLGAVNSDIITDVVRSCVGKKIEMVVVKSTVTPDIILELKKIFKHIVYNPEFLTEKSANEQFVDPQFHIFGGDKKDCKDLEKIYKDYSLCNDCPAYTMSLEEASFVKYTINSFLAMKVTFFNQLYDAIGDTDANFARVIKAVGADSRIGSSHTKVPGFDGKQGYGGACFPKDTSAFTKFSNKLTLLEECIRINNNYRLQHELDDREIEQNVNYGQTKKEQ